MIDHYPQDPAAALAAVQSMTDDQLENWMWRYPGVIQEMFRMVSERFELFENPEMQKMAIHLWGETRRKSWRGWWLGNIPADTRLLVVSTLCHGNVTQEVLNFLTLADVPAAKYQMIKAYDPTADYNSQSYQAATLDEFYIEEAAKNLASAFGRQMVEEAAPDRSRIVLGNFVMERVPLDYLDALIRYDTVRLSIAPTGICGSLVNEANYLTFWWSPEGTTTWSLGAKHAWAVNTMLACIWRDACVVKYQMFQERSRSIYKPRRGKKQKLATQKLILPRLIKRGVWGRDAERERITHAEHGVRAFYRQLPADQQSSQAARNMAAKFGYPWPPQGFTFVRPHTRGSGDGGEAVEAMPVVCLGLQVAHLALGRTDNG